MLRIRLLGELQVEANGREIELPGSWRARSLLAWLAAHPGTHQRSEVAPLFWPEILDESARASLRNALWAIRKALGPDAEALIATRERIGLAEPPAVWIDASEFAVLAERGELAAALELSRGVPLAGMEDEWIYEFRDDHRLALSRLFGRLAGEAASAGDRAAAIEWARKRVALDALDEAAQRDLIARMIEADDRSGAISAYGRFRQKLRSELGISPSAETRALVLELQADPPGDEPVPGDAPAPAAAFGGEWRAGSEFPLPSRLAAPAATGLVGRATEITRLRELWAQVEHEATPRLALVSGEAGIGKSRLASELARELQSRGAIVLHGRADEELLVPHRVWIDALDHLLASAATGELRAPAEDLGPLAPRLVPAPADTAAPAEAGGQAESRRYRMFEAAATLLESASALAPVVIVVDDLQWADESSVALLQHALESRHRLKLLIIATLRSGVELSESVRGTLSRLDREGFLVRIELDGLPSEEIAELSQSVSDGELADALLKAIGSESAGNPFFVQELVRHINDSGEDAGVLSLTRAEVPDRVREVVNLRLARLSDPAVRLLTVAAVIGTEFDLPVLAEVSNADADEVLAMLDDALAAALVTERERDDDIFAFSHALVRRTLLGHVSRAQRRRIHARIAEALETSRGDAAVLEIAHHLCEARNAADREKAFEYAMRAAESAIDDLAYAEAVDFFTKARLALPANDERSRTVALKRAVAFQALFHAMSDTAEAGNG